MTGTTERVMTEAQQRKSAARLYAVQALFQMESLGQDADRTIREFEAHRFGETLEEGEMADGHVDLFRQIVSEAVNHQARIDQMADRAIVKSWKIDRIDPTIRALLRAAGTELVLAKTPPRVVIVEYLDVADAFYPDGPEKGFVNAVLDHMAREARPEAFQKT